jgi:hypothetical protein
MRRTAAARASRGAALAPLALALAAGPAALPGPLQAQEVLVTGPQLTAAITQRFEADSNYNLDDPSPGTSYFADTRFAFGLLNETPSQVFALDIDTGIRALWEAEEDFEFTAASPSTAALAYAQEWSDGALDARLRFRQNRVDYTLPFDFLIDPDDPLPSVPDDPSQREDDALERRYDATFGLAFATQSRSSYALGLDATRIDYDETADDLTPRDTLSGDATWTLQLTPILATDLTGSYLYYEADNDENTQINEAQVTASLVYNPTEVLRTSLGLGWTDRQQRETVTEDGVRVRQTTEDEQGLVGVGSLRYDFEDFLVNANLRLTNVNADNDLRLTGDVRLVYPLQNSRVTARVFQRYAGGDTGDEVLITGAGIGLLRELDAVSRVEFDVAASRREEQEDDDPDTDRLEFSAVYSYDFTELLSGDIGYRYRYLDEDDTASSNAVFVQISRAFETRP